MLKSFGRLTSNIGSFRKCSTTVDIHSHFLPYEWPDFAEKFGTANGPWPWMRHKNNTSKKHDAMLMLGDQEFRPVLSRCWNMSQRLEDMDRDGVDVQIISNTPILFQYHRSVEQTIEVARHFNDHALEMVKESNGRLVTLAQVPLNDTDAACEEASRAMKTGHHGIQIGNHVGPLDLDADRLVAFLAHCADDNIPVLVHPWDMLGGDRLKNYMMAWTVGMPAETHLSIVAMILSGAFDRLPKSLKLCFAHGGGAFAFLLPRLENAYLHRDIARGNALMPPSHYTDRFSVDSAVFGAGALRLLTDTMGSERVMLGSDYPFPLGEQSVGSLARTACADGVLTPTERDRILGQNALAFWNIPEPSSKNK